MRTRLPLRVVELVDGMTKRFETVIVRKEMERKREKSMERYHARVWDGTRSLPSGGRGWNALNHALLPD